MFGSSFKKSIIIIFSLTTLLFFTQHFLYTSIFSEIALDKNRDNANLVSKINLLISEKNWSNRQERSSILSAINRIERVAGWQLLDSQNAVISDRGEKNFSTHQPLYFYVKSNSEKLNEAPNVELLTLKVFTKADIENSLPLPSDVLIVFIVFLVSVVASVLFYFYWIKDLEKHSLDLLTEQQSLSHQSITHSENPIAQIINQLVLRNTHLLQDKTDLTDQIRKISYVDEITELGNELFFKAEFQVRLYNHEEEESGLMILLGFNQFDNDKNSLLSDKTLKEVAFVIRNFSQDYPNSLVARLRDFDFALLVPNQTKKNTDKLCRNLIEQLEKSVFDKLNLNSHFVDIGISAYRQGFDYFKIIAEADMALRNAQLQGGNSWFMYGEPLKDGKVKGSIRWKNFLESVLDKRQIALYEQKVNFYHSEPFQLSEVLVRIEDGQEILLGDHFLPMASYCGLSVNFDRQVIDSLIKHCMTESDDSIAQFYSINLFIKSLLDEKFVHWLVQKLSSYPELTHRLVFELNESCINENYSAVKPIINQLSDLGVSWSIDKFGSIDASIALIEQLPIRCVKFDRRIIHNIHKNREQQLYLQSLLVNFNSLKVITIAQGVEKALDADYLKKTGINASQGYFYHIPSRIKQIERYLKAI